jgi:predicted kinase
MKTLYIIRGCPGSGKSTLAQEKFLNNFEADMYHYDKDGNYNFDISKLGEAHKWCQNQVETLMKVNEEEITVSNTSTTEKELKPYMDLAEKYGYRVISLIVENRHGGKNIHGVPSETLTKMKERFNIKL